MFDEAVKSQKSNGTVKSFRCKARKSDRMRRTLPVRRNDQGCSACLRASHGGNAADGLFTKPSMFKRPLAGKDHGYRRVSFVARLD